MKTTRRSFLTQSAAVTSGFLGLGKLLHANPVAVHSPYGPLLKDPRGILDLPAGFSFAVISRTGDRMKDGFKVPGQPDGMGCFAHDEKRVILVRNHEIGQTHFSLGPFDGKGLPASFAPEMSYDPGRFGAGPFFGGTTTVVFNTRTGEVENDYLSLTGTDRNCAGGVTPWNSWITCEEPADLLSQWGKDHGYAFEVPAAARGGLTKPLPLRGMGRFRHEAIAVDPETGFVYETEDQGDSAIYRFIPREKGNLAAGGKLQALKVTDSPGLDTRNRKDASQIFPVGSRVTVTWIDLEEVDTPKDDLRVRAVEKGAAIFSRGEGMWHGSANTTGENTIYWACTDGGRDKYGQIFRYFPETEEMDLYLEPNDSALLTNADNLTVSPRSGHLYICEDTSGANHVRGVTKKGELFTFAKNPAELDSKKGSSEFTGACFSPDGNTLFVNIQTPGITLAISGPFV